MRVNKELNPVAMQHMAQNALDARNRAGLSRSSAAEDAIRSVIADAVASGNAASGTGKNLPSQATAADHDRGLQRAIERLRENAQKSPEARGLQQALEMLQRNAERSAEVDTEA